LTNYYPEVAACAEQCSQNRPPGTEAVPCQTADVSTTLAASSTQNWLQNVCVDIKTLNTSVTRYLSQHINRRVNRRTLPYAVC